MCPDRIDSNRGIIGGTVRAHIAELERQLAEAREAASQCCDGYEGQLQMLTTVNRDLNAQIEEMRKTLCRISRGAELQAHVMRDPLRTGGWAGAEKVADAFDDIADRARAALQDRAPAEGGGDGR